MIVMAKKKYITMMKPIERFTDEVIASFYLSIFFSLTTL